MKTHSRYYRAKVVWQVWSVDSAVSSLFEPESSWIYMSLYYLKTFRLSKAWNEINVWCLCFRVSGQKSHHQNYEDVHGEVCHGEFSVLLHHSVIEPGCVDVFGFVLVFRSEEMCVEISELQTSLVDLFSDHLNLCDWLNVSTGGVRLPGSSGHVRLCGRHQAGQTGRALSKSDVMSSEDAFDWFD